MHGSTAAHILRDLARRELLSVRDTTFTYVRYPHPVHPRDVKEAFVALADHLYAKKSDLTVTVGESVDAWTSEKLFEKLFKIIYVDQKLFPVIRSQNLEGFRSDQAPLPSLTVSSEKTQIRQIPLVDVPPWPFRHLLELGGMIVCRPKDRREFLTEMKTYLNNFPQFRMKVHAEEWPTGEILVVTTFFAEMAITHKKENLNVP
jgi:hypothetical protein